MGTVRFADTNRHRPATPRMAQPLARHSSITLTMDRYTHVGLLDSAGALESLPPLFPSSSDGSEAARATGTDGAPCARLALPVTNTGARLMTDDETTLTRGVAPGERKPL